MDDKYYLFRYPSKFGMGSNYDVRLVSDRDLRRVIRRELEKGTDRPDERLTGRWNDEVFCDSTDMEEVIEDVIKKRSTSCTTYAGVNDLIVVPEFVSHSVVEEHLSDVIVHLWNQWWFCSDVIIGEATFFSHFLDLRECEGFGGLDHGDRYEFCPYELKNVLVNGYLLDDWNTRKEMYEVSKQHHEELLQKLIESGDPFAEEVRIIIQEKAAGLKRSEGMTDDLCAGRALQTVFGGD